MLTEHKCQFLKDVFVCVVDEGYQRRVTVDDEDSTILVYDSWKQVSQKLSQMHKSRFALKTFFIFSGFQNLFRCLQGGSVLLLIEMH